jgi:hypothetical protein
MENILAYMLEYQWQKNLNKIDYYDVELYFFNSNTLAKWVL